MSHKKAYLHIGAAKCASSLIQRILNEQGSKDLVPIRYMDALSRVIQSYSPVMDFSDHFTIETYRSIKEQLPKEDILFSVENVFGMHSHRPNSYAETTKVLEYLFEGYDIKILFFVRRQDTYLASNYNQDVTRGETRTFEDYIEECLMDNFHWFNVAENYSAFDLTVLPFEKKVLETGGYKDFMDGLYQWLGQKVEVTNLPHINPSLTTPAMEVQRFANYMLTQQEAYDLSLWMEKHCPKKLGDPPEEIEGGGKILAHYKESNKKLFKKYMPQFDGSYYWR